MSQVTGKSLKDLDVAGEVPSGSVNSSNVSFILANTPDNSQAVQVLLNGVTQKYTTDYSISGTTITFTTAPATAQTLFVNYRKKT